MVFCALVSTSAGELAPAGAQVECALLAHLHSARAGGKHVHVLASSGQYAHVRVVLITEKIIKKEEKKWRKYSDSMKREFQKWGMEIKISRPNLFELVGTMSSLLK